MHAQVWWITMFLNIGTLPLLRKRDAHNFKVEHMEAINNSLNKIIHTMTCVVVGHIYETLINLKSIDFSLLIDVVNW